MAQSNPQSERADVYARITAQIVAAIEAGAGEYRMPWHGSDPSIARPINVASGKAYRGVNRLALWIAAQSACYPSGVWGTYRHWQALGAQVRKGERATTVVFWKEVGPLDRRTTARTSFERRRFLARGYSVFNQAQVDNYEADVPPCCLKRRASRRLTRSTPISASARSTADVRLTFSPRATGSTCPRSRPSKTRRPTTASSIMRRRMPRRPRIGSGGTCRAASAQRRMRWRRSWPTSVPAWCWPTWVSRLNPGLITPPISHLGSRAEAQHVRLKNDTAAIFTAAEQGPGRRGLDACPAAAADGDRGLITTCIRAGECHTGAGLITAG